MKRLQILINHYREKPDIIGRLLTSIAKQTGVVPDTDYGVMIASDGAENPLDKAFLDGFPFRIRYSVLPHRGVCPTRNALLDMATADYVMFCDADDMVSSPHGLSVLLNAAKDGADVVSVPFLAERKDGDGFRYVRIPCNAVWVHGKIFRRAYLAENAIRFDDNVDSPGEQYFLWQAFRLTKNVRSLSDCFYTWKWNDDSVTRAKPFFSVRTYGEMLGTYSRLADNLLERERNDLRDELIATMMSHAYIDSNSGNWDAAPPDYVSAAKAAVAECVRRYRARYEAIGEAVRRRKYNAALVSKRVRGPSGGFAGITDWMNGL